MNRSLKRFGTFVLLFVLVYVVVMFGCKRTRINFIEANVGIEIPFCTRISNSNKMMGQDYSQELEVKFTEKGLENVLEQIKQSKYFDLHHSFSPTEESGWKINDTTLYHEIKGYLKGKHLTGYWILNGSDTLVFHEPDFSDIPVSAILFDEAYEVEAELFVKEKKMIFRYIKI